MIESFSRDETEEIKYLLNRSIIEEGRDVTSDALFSANDKVHGHIIAKEACTLAGLPGIAFTCDQFGLSFYPKKTDGAELQPGQAICDISGNILPLLKAERFMLNLLGHLSGIATITGKFVEQFAPTPIFDTRKTTTCWRHLEKYAVRIGGGKNHRMSLEDKVLVKDNHFAALNLSGKNYNIKSIVQKIRESNPNVTIEIEVETENAFQQAVGAGADIVMLDNWETKDVIRAFQWLKQYNYKVITELSGGISLKRAKELALLGANRISVGAITHSAPNCDFSMEL